MTRRYPKEFYVQRERVLERDGYVCILCWRGPLTRNRDSWQSYGLDVHHIDYYRLETSGTGQDYVDSNIPDWYLVTLCDSCHGKIATADPRSPFRLGLTLYVLGSLLGSLGLEDMERVKTSSDG